MIVYLNDLCTLHIPNKYYLVIKSIYLCLKIFVRILRNTLNDFD